MTTSNKSIIGNAKSNEFKIEVTSPEELLAKYGTPKEEPKGSSKVRKPRKEEPIVEQSKVESPVIQNNDFIYIPNIKLWVSKQRYYLNSDWNKCQTHLHSQHQRMPTLPEFGEFLNYTRINFPEIYNEIIGVRNPWRSEWIDANFKLEKNKLYVYFHEFDLNGKIIQRKEQLDSTTLMQDKPSGISLEAWLNDANSQGFPKTGIQNGNLSYWKPINRRVARFGADSVWVNLNCSRDPSDSYDFLGVRIVRK